MESKSISCYKYMYFSKFYRIVNWNKDISRHLKLLFFPLMQSFSQFLHYVLYVSVFTFKSDSTHDRMQWTVW